MTTYEQYLTQLLNPLGIYNLSSHSISGAAIHALGTALDQLSLYLEHVEREAILATAEAEGLDHRESLFAHRPAAVTSEDRRAAITALLRVDGDSLTPAAINATLLGCGIQAKAIEKGNGKLLIVFPQLTGEPLADSPIQKIILDILPCHLDIEFYFHYLTWEICETAEMTWSSVEAARHTWQSFELAGDISS